MAHAIMIGQDRQINKARRICNAAGSGSLRLHVPKRRPAIMMSGFVAPKAALATGKARAGPGASPRLLPAPVLAAGIAGVTSRTESQGPRLVLLVLASYPRGPAGRTGSEGLAAAECKPGAGELGGRALPLSGTASGIRAAAGHSLSLADNLKVRVPHNPGCRRSEPTGRSGSWPAGRAFPHAACAFSLSW
jgi:hypothetical protein